MIANGAGRSRTGARSARILKFEDESPRIEAFDATAPTGLVGALILAAALPGQSETGTFTLTGEWWSDDPFGAGVFLQNADPLVVDFSLGVIGTAATVPVPGTLWLWLSAVPMLAWQVQAARNKRQQFAIGAH